jgi:hypothetical protein
MRELKACVIRYLEIRRLDKSGLAAFQSVAGLAAVIPLPWQSPWRAVALQKKRKGFEANQAIIGSLNRLSPPEMV